jgi:hypothetical protein
MAYLIAGLLIGITFTLLWQKYYKGMPVFQLLMQRELALNGQLGSITELKKKLDQIEKRLDNLESDLSDAVVREEYSPKLEIVPGVRSDSQRGGVARPDKKLIRGKVLEMWGEGSSITEIASKTSLGQGEIELIISLQGNG